MADQSGRYQQWLAAPVNTRNPILGANSIFIVTPDTRFAQGATLEAQAAAPGTLWGRHVPGENWARPERGTWRWSYYRTVLGDSVAYIMGGASDLWLELDADEARLLRAEGLFRTGNLQGAADLINVSRVAAGLNATNSAGLNTSCVPKLWNGSCGNLFEMLKWEKRMASFAVGPNGSGWYTDSRAWQDLYEGTWLHFPVPARELAVLGMPVYTFGGVGGEGAAPESNYHFPGE
jgi:starch-binding outer membrane protein, SusD/RagB family